MKATHSSPEQHDSSTRDIPSGIILHLGYCTLESLLCSFSLEDALDILEVLSFLVVLHVLDVIDILYILDVFLSLMFLMSLCHGYLLRPSYP